MTDNYVPEIDKVTSDYYIACHYFPGWNVHPNGYSAFADIVDFPERTPLIGFYDEANPEVFDRETKWACEHGINCFIYCRYRNFPEKMKSPITQWVLTPQSWKELLTEVKKTADSLPESALGRKMVILDNWNEWCEGHYIAPHRAGGFKYLQAVREVFTKCDNFPDYRLPQSLGLGPYDKNIKADAERIWYSF
ncbi:MAG: glycoside hydrolase family 99-like domain-containing protein [Clostridia bacterium]|nr:glycoside hydrolase family 99-like domain-containing protein [Clostridia bacterium]